MLLNNYPFLFCFSFFPFVQIVSGVFQFVQNLFYSFKTAIPAGLFVTQITQIIKGQGMNTEIIFKPQITQIVKGQGMNTEINNKTTDYTDYGD